MKHGGNRKGAGMKTGLKKTKLKPPEQIKHTKGIRYTHEEIKLIEEAVRRTQYKNFSRYVVERSVAAAKHDIAEATDNKQINATQHALVPGFELKQNWGDNEKSHY